MSAHDDNRPMEFIIVKRDSSHEEGHHGGAWKIAFADFMTAMMALFLVLWLVNAANEQTRKAVASYFNPVKLVDRSRGEKGMDDAGGPAGTAEEAAKAEPDASKVSLDIPPLDESTDEQLFADPQGVLDHLAAQFQQSPETGAADPSAPADGHTDPFAPQYWERQKAEEPQPQEEARADVAGEPDPGRFGGKEAAEPPAENPLKEAAEQLGADIKAALGEALGANAPVISDVAVTVVDKGVLISVTDGIKSSMFRIGSAVPNSEMVVAMGKIGEVLAQRQGKVRINGHTDGRPYGGGQYDNWRLSSARAQAAYHMLVRGGLDEQRIARVSGFADRELKNPADPNADVNRRIEIFLESEP